MVLKSKRTSWRWYLVQYICVWGRRNSGTFKKASNVVEARGASFGPVNKVKINMRSSVYTKTPYPDQRRKNWNDNYNYTFSCIFCNVRSKFNSSFNLLCIYIFSTMISLYNDIKFYSMRREVVRLWKSLADRLSLFKRPFWKKKVTAPSNELLPKYKTGEKFWVMLYYHSSGASRMTYFF